MGTHRIHAGGVVCLLVLFVLAAAFGPPAALAKKVRIPRAAKMHEYDPLLEVGDTRIYWITQKVWGIENVEGTDAWAGFTEERVAGPFDRNGREDVFKLYSPGLYQEYYTVKRRTRLIHEIHTGSATYVFKKPLKHRRKMRFGRTYKRKSVYQYTDLDGELEDTWVIRKEELTAERGREWSGEFLDFEDTIVVTSDYVERSGDGLNHWNGDSTTRYARGIGPVMIEDEWVYSYTIYTIFGTYRIGYRDTMELAYARIGGVEYGDPTVAD
ncbi:MAG: hypothetical protein ABFS86_07505 [Planctomycetota bacterium]